MVITTRLSILTFQLINTYDYCVKMKFLDMDKSWKLFRKTVFGVKACPDELEKIGKKIFEGCKGLPLSIVVIGGLLAKSKHKREFWEFIGENLNSIVNLEDDERSLKVLYMSYNQLPVYLKPCFLYMGIFPEDNVIHVSMLINLCVAEGFLKPVSGKSLEEVARMYFLELLDRNIILVHELGATGNIKNCKIHNLLRDLCLREAQKERFYTILKQQNLNIPQDIDVAHRNIVLPELLSPEDEIPDALQSMSLARSLICYSRSTSPPPLKFRLLRILKGFDKDFGWRQRYSPGNMYDLVNLRYIAIMVGSGTRFFSLVCHFWNLHTLIVNTEATAPSEIWKMSQLRHAKFSQLVLPDPPSNDHDIILGNLQALSAVTNFKCTKSVVMGIKNIKKLRVLCCYIFGGTSHYFFNNLEHLHKLESFSCSCNFLFSSELSFLQNLTFPHSLKKLAIHNFRSSEGILEKIGLLPLLEKLILTNGEFKECKWETVEGHFSALKFLKIESSSDLMYWTTNGNNFARLEHLVLRGLSKLEEIPSQIGETPTLQLIDLSLCSDSAVISAKNVQLERKQKGDEDLQVRVR